MKLNYADLSKQAKIGYNALYNIIFANSSFDNKEELKKFTVPLCLDTNNRVSLTEKNFIYFDSVLEELKLYGYYAIKNNSGRAVEDSKTDFSTVEIYLSKKPVKIPEDVKNFVFTDVDLNKLMKRNGKAEKAKTAENKEKKEQEQKTAEKNSKELEEKTAEVKKLKQEVAEKKEQEQKTAEKTSKELEEKTAEVKKLKQEVAEKNEQLSKKEKKEIDDFNDEALFSIANCIEFLIKKHCPIPAEFEFKAFETELFQVISAHWDLKILNK